MTMSEIDDLRDALQRVGVVGHAHEGMMRDAAGVCVASAYACISQEDETTARVVDPRTGRMLHVDAMTAVSVLSDLDTSAGADQAWAELAEIDHGD